MTTHQELRDVPPAEPTAGPSAGDAAQTLRELRRSEARYRALAEAASQAVWAWDPETGQGDFSGTQLWWATLTGQSPEEQSSHGFTGWLEPVHPDDRERARAAWLGAMETGREYAIEYRVRRHDGDWASVLARAVAVRGPDGEVREWVGTLADVTEQRRAADALRASEERFAKAFRASPEALGIALEADGRLLEVNESWERLFACPRAEAIGKNAVELGLYADLAERPRIIAELKEQGFLRDHELAIQSRTGERRQVSFSVETVELDGRACHLTIIHDVTERRRAEEALREESRRKDEFLAMLAHELRNPLAPIASAVEVLRLVAPAEPRLDQARQVVERQVAHLARLVDDLLDVSRITRGLVTLRTERLELGTIVARAVETSRPLLDARRQALEVSLPAAPVWVEADLTRIAQVLSNLLNNASKFSPEGARIWLAAEAAPGEAVLRVRDEGIGIPPEVLPYVFDLFAQADRSLDRSQGGLGIGLTLVRTLVEMHGGRVEAASAGLGQGSELTVRLPALPPDLAAEPQPSGAAVERAPGAAGRRLLVVDDNVDAAESMALLLALDGHQVRVAHDGHQALALAGELAPQAVLLDIGLPGMDGYEVARRLRESAATRAALLVALTGYGQEEDRRRSLDAGFDHHLVKPVDLDTLRRLLGD